ncbi:hypothetical protein SAMN04487843_10776 [Methylobacterium sp. ap11]|uniref:IS110 family transposase n=1 Tax=Methylobacterium sp. ap11 TaxID=1761799 RepID=UPI0008C464C1|nr:transposase [Methylobacterium sp. ap11]SEP13382.1 hypothetical protein SAMN04487843_10776 [Methylobacterium sp. ap11]
MEVLYLRCADLDIYKETVVAAIRLAEGSKVPHEVRTFATTRPAPLDLSAWLDGHGCTHVAMEAAGIYWRPVWRVLDADTNTLILANAAHVENVPGRKTALVQAAGAGVRKNVRYTEARFQRLRGRRGPEKAICAVSSSMLTAIHHMLVTGTDCAIPGPITAPGLPPPSAQGRSSGRSSATDLPANSSPSSRFLVRRRLPRQPGARNGRYPGAGPFGVPALHRETPSR